MKGAVQDGHEQPQVASSRTLFVPVHSGQKQLQLPSSSLICGAGHSSSHLQLQEKSQFFPFLHGLAGSQTHSQFSFFIFPFAQVISGSQTQLQFSSLI